jgi:YVTN family beta-propeller protein
VDFRILGPLEVRDQGREPEIAASKQRALLAILLLHANEVVSSDRLIEELWGERPPASAAKSLQVYVSRLRRALDREPGNGADDIIVTRGGGYLVRVEPGELDLAQFERLVEEGSVALAQGSPDYARELLREALSLWRGPPLADFAYESFAQPEIARLEELHLSAVELRIEAELALGRHARLVGELETLVERHPFRERLHAQLMLALYRSGRQAEALETYQQARRMLVDQLGIEPSEELGELERAILNHDASLAAPAIALPEVAPNGEEAAASAPLPARARRRPVVVAGLLLAALVLVGVVVLVVFAGDGGGGVAPLAADSHAVAVIDPDSNEVVEHISVGAGPGQLAYDRQTGSLWVANLDDETVTRIDPRRRRSGRTVAIGNVPDGLAAAGGQLWVAGHGRGVGTVNVRRVDERFYTTELTKRIPAIGPQTTDLALAAGELWVAPTFGLLTRIDARTGSHRRTFDTDHQPMVVAAGAESVWVADTLVDRVTRVDPASGVTTDIPVGNGPAGIALGRGAVWVTLRGDDSLMRLDRDSGAAGKTVRVGRGPGGVATGAEAVWVANSADGTVSRVDPETGEVVATITVGASPQDILVASGMVWVTVSPSVQERAALRGTARITFAFDPSAGSLDPALGWAIQPWMVSYATGAKLLNYPDEPGPAGSRLVPEVAASLPRRSADGRTYTFKIRRGFRFSPPSNEPVTAQTFKYSIERALSPKMHGPGLLFLRDVVGADDFASGRTRHIAGITAQGDTLTFHLSNPSGDFASRIATPFFTAVPVDTPIDPEAVRDVSGAGPYYVTSHSRRLIVLRPNPNYRGPRPHRLREIRITVGVGQGRALRAVEGGAADYAMPSVSNSDAARLARRYGPGSESAGAAGQRYFVNPWLGLDYLAMNTSRGLFSSASMRRAVSYAIDRRALARAGATSGLGSTPTDQYLPPGMPGFRNVRLYPLHPSVDRARRLAGPGRRTAVLYARDSTADRQHAEIVKANLKAIGIDVQIQTFSDAVFYKRLGRKGEPYDLALSLWLADYADPVTFLGFFDPRRGPGNPNPSTDVSHFHEPGYTRRLAAAERLSPPERYVAYGRLESDLARNAAPWAAIGNPVSRDFFSRRIGCQVFHPLYGIDLAALCIRR